MKPRCVSRWKCQRPYPVRVFGITGEFCFPGLSQLFCILNTMKYRATVLVTALLLSVAAIAAEPARDLASLGFIKGYSWGFVGNRGEYASPAAADSMKKMAATGTQWACIAFATDMTTAETPEIRFGDANPKMVSDQELKQAIDLARASGMKVILKPVINCADQTWRAWIKFYRPITDEERAKGITGEMDKWQTKSTMRKGEVRDLQKWDRWWKDYSAFIVHYAKIAEEKQVPVLCLGCEMNSTEEFVDHWRELIAEVRKVYGGFLTYDVNHDSEENVKWWDMLDFISISAYYAVNPTDGRSLDEAVKETTPVSDIAKRLEAVKQRLAKISAKWHKPILFIETGVVNMRGFGRYPWTHIDEKPDTPLDGQEQANYYEAFFETFWDVPWCLGFVWWDWPATLYDASEANSRPSFCVYGKKAEEVVRQWYAKPRETPIVAQ